MVAKKLSKNFVHDVMTLKSVHDVVALNRYAVSGERRGAAPNLRFVAVKIRKSRFVNRSG